MTDADRIDGYLDETLDAEGERALADRLVADPAFAARFARSLLLHDRLGDRFRASAIPGASGPIPADPPAGRRRFAAWLALAAAVVAACAILFPRNPWQRVDAAEVALQRLIAEARRPVDRTFRIRALDEPRPDPNARGRVQPTIDGATLYVRGNGRYVLDRGTDDGGRFLTGSDGREAWSIPPDGPVRVSDDPGRFRGALPGEQQDLPFLDLGNALGRLRESYLLELLGDDPTGPRRRLVARKRSSGDRGPRLVTVEFDGRDGAILTMRLEGLPQARGGPRGVVLERQGESDLGPDFFDHRRHHAPDRRVVREPR